MTTEYPEDDDRARRDTLEAFADTVIPGEKRWPGDRAVAGVSTGGGAVAAGAVQLLEDPAGGLADSLDGLAESLNEHALEYAGERGIPLDASVPAFVALGFADRTALVQRLVAPGHPEKEMWVALLMFSNMAFDTGAQAHTSDEFVTVHPGLSLIRFERPDTDGLWRFPDFSYRRTLASLHPDTTATGSPA